MSNAAITKTDLKKELAYLYNPSAQEVTLVRVPSLQFLMIDGAGDPNSAQEYQAAVEALYSMAYSLKFLLKQECSRDYTVMPLEGLWWVSDMREFSVERKGDWLWTMMILQPQEVTAARFAQALEQTQRKKNQPALAKLRLERLDEGLAAQILHRGPYSAEGPTVARLHNFIAEQGATLDGLRRKHHEIYLSDPRRAVPEKMKTVIRQPIAK